jgi:ABC-type cobalamin/Fe3+-siderophores transport system ATPase subunit
VKDSGWIDAENITALIGANESGKTNLLLPLWKLNPAKEGEINLLSDLPRREYNKMRDAEPKPDFVEAWFAVPDYSFPELRRIMVSIRRAFVLSVSRETSTAIRR